MLSVAVLAVVAAADAAATVADALVALAVVAGDVAVAADELAAVAEPAVGFVDSVAITNTFVQIFMIVRSFSCQYIYVKKNTKNC